MAGGVLFQLLVSGSLFSLGVYELGACTYSFLKNPRDYSAKPFHPLPSPRLRHLPLYMASSFLLISLILNLISAATPDPLIASVHLFTSLQSSAVLLLFLLLSLLLLLLSDSFPSDLLFALASVAFFLHSSASDSHSVSLSASSALESKLDTLQSKISLLSSLLSLLLAFFPRLFLAHLAFSASLSFHALWILQSTLSLHVDRFIPDGCHRLLDLVSGVEGSTACELDHSKLRALAILDLMFVIYVLLLLVLVFSVYAIVAKALGVTSARRLGAYEPLPTTTANNGPAAIDTNHVQLKTITGNQE